MSDTTRNVYEAMERLRRRDPTFKVIDLFNKRLGDSYLVVLADCLLAHPDVVAHVYLSRNQLTDETGIKLARYLAASSTIESLSLRNNQLGPATYLAVAAALRVNTSLQYLDLNSNQALDETSIDAAFVEALRINPDRPMWSDWWLYTYSNDFHRLQAAACALGPPSMLAQLDFAQDCIEK